MKTIGILGGLGPESTIEYYAHIIRQYYKIKSDYNYPEIIIHSLTFEPFIENGYNLPKKIKSSIESLAKAGADFVIAACNSVHVVFDEVSCDIPVPWVSIMSATAEQVQRKGLKKVALLGTIFTMEGSFYKKTFSQFNIETVIPNPEEQKNINQIIYDELVLGKTVDSSRDYIISVIDRLRSENNTQGIILGCTELPFLIKQNHTNIPVFDTTTIHAQKALDLALSDEPITST